MLKVRIPDQELFDEKAETFVYVKGAEIQLEHSLISLSKWESKWHKPFLGNEKKTEAQIKDYIRCMTITQNVNPELYEYIPPSILKETLDYIDNPMTATWFSDAEKKKAGIGKKEIITSEIIYYWMISLNIPVQFEKWHLNRLITLIRVINAKNSNQKKMSKKDILSRNARINAERRAKSKSKG